MNKTSIAQQAKTTSSLLSPAQGLLQRKCACGNHTVAGGQCSECAKKKSGLQHKLSIGVSNDPLEREADRVADQVMSNRFTSTSSISSAFGILQREDVGKEKTNEEKYKEGLEKLGEAFLKTPLGKELIEKLKQDALVKGATQLGKDFISTLPGKIITGTAATGAVATLAATHKQLPAQIPEIPLDFVAPGLSVNLTYKGPIDKPTEAMITFKFTEQKASSSSGIKPMSASEQYRAETARLADEQAKFRANLRYKPGSPEDLKQREEDEALQNASLKYRGGIDTDAIIKQSSGLATPEPKSGLQLTMPKPSFGSQSPSVFGDEFKLKLPEIQKKKEAPVLQKKLRIGASNDPLELEADRVADQVLSGSTIFAVSHSVPGISRFTAQPSEHSDEIPASVNQVLASSGNPLEANLKQDMESRFGYDFSSVRVHSDGISEQSAQDVNANAYTVGNKVVFGKGQFSPNTHEGRRLIAHELMHVVQQSDSGNNSILRRQVKRGAAGGCGICMNDPGGRRAGEIAHVEIQAAFTADNPNINTHGEFQVPVVEEGMKAPFIPEVDLSYETIEHSQKIMNIGEIKPLDDAGQQVGIARRQLQDYARELMANPELKYDEVFRMRDAPPSYPIPFFNPDHPPGCPPQMIYVNRTEPGIYQYYCEPPFSTLVKDPRCRCKKDDDEEKKKKDLAKPLAKPEQKQENEKKTSPQQQSSVIPEVAIGVGGAAATAAAIAYLRKRAIAEAERKATQLAMRKWAERVAARKAAEASGKSIAGKTVGKAVVYGKIAAAAALIIFYSDRVEAKPGPGESAIESLFKAMTTNGAPPSPEMKALIESDPVLKQLAEEAAISGDGSKLQEEMSRRTLELIRDNPEAFTPEDLEFLTEFTKTAKASGKSSQTVDQLHKAIDAAKAGKTGNDNSTSTDSDNKKGESGGGKTEQPGQAGTPTPSTLPKTPEERLVEGMASKEANGPKFSSALKEKLLATARAITPPLTEKEVNDLLTRLDSAVGKSEEEIVESVRKGVTTLRTGKGSDSGLQEKSEPGEGSKPDISDKTNGENSGPKVDIDKVDPAKPPPKDVKEIISAYDKFIAKMNWVADGTAYLSMPGPLYETGKTYSLIFLGRDSDHIPYVGQVAVTIGKKTNDSWTVTIAAGAVLYTKGRRYGTTRSTTDKVTPPKTLSSGGGTRNVNKK